MKHRLLAALTSLLLVAFVATGCKSTTTSSPSSAGQTSNTSVAASAPGSASAATDCPTSNTTSFAKTKFLLHAGLAFGAFHRYLYKPYQAGTFKSGAHGRIRAFLKSGLAALYIKREVRLASADVAANPTLCKAIGAPLRSIGDGIQAAVSKLKGGDASALTAIQSTVTSVEGKAAHNGTTVTENANAPLK
jgi:hypothetical protein